MSCWTFCHLHFSLFTSILAYFPSVFPIKGKPVPPPHQQTCQKKKTVRWCKWAPSNFATNFYRNHKVEETPWLAKLLKSGVHFEKKNSNKELWIRFCHCGTSLSLWKILLKISKFHVALCTEVWSLIPTFHTNTLIIMKRLRCTFLVLYI